VCYFVENFSKQWNKQRALKLLLSFPEKQLNTAKILSVCQWLNCSRVATNNKHDFKLRPVCSWRIDRHLTARKKNSVKSKMWEKSKNWTLQTGLVKLKILLSVFHMGIIKINLKICKISCLLIRIISEIENEPQILSLCLTHCSR